MSLYAARPSFWLELLNTMTPPSTAGVHSPPTGMDQDTLPVFASRQTMASLFHLALRL